jgi:peptidoglycan hydrolase CwlO-like protein
MDYLSYIAMAVSILTLLIGYLSYKNKVSTADYDKWAGQIRNLKETDFKEMQEKIRDIKENISELYKLYNDSHTGLSVLKERIDNEINMLEKLEKKLDEIKYQLKE